MESALKRKDGEKKFDLLCQVVAHILILPHSDADEERIFSTVRKNKTTFRPNLSLRSDLYRSSFSTVCLFPYFYNYTYIYLVLTVFSIPVHSYTLQCISSHPDEIKLITNLCNILSLLEGS